MSIHYTDPRLDVPPGVDFLDAGQTQVWVAACEANKPWRDPMRRRFAELVAVLAPGARVLELGSGPGYLAEAVLASCPDLESYTLLDFSEHMLALSRERLARFNKTVFIKADFKRADWWRELSAPYTAVLAMQSVHEIRHKRHAPGFYAQIRRLLAPGGVLAVCDGTPRDKSVLWQVALCMTVDEQVAAFASAGFTEVRLEEEVGAMIFVSGRAAGLKLVLPDKKYEQSYRAYIQGLGDETRYPFPLDFAHDDFEQLLRRLQEFRDGKDIPEGFVPSTTFWLVRDNELLGVSNLRHYLNERIRRHGGHIGLGIRPSQRGRGLGKILLKLTLEEARKRGISTVHVHCHKHNQPSARMIVANGGVLESEVEEPSGDMVQRYLIQEAPS